MSQFLDPKFNTLAPYTPGEQPQREKLVKLNTNELPYPPPPSVVQAATQQAGRVNLYNDPDASCIVEPLAKALGVATKNVFVGNGSDEVLAFTFQGLCPNGALFADLTYGFYPVYAQLYGCGAKVVPLEDDFTLDTRKYYRSKRTVFIANPNAPTSLALAREEIEALLQENPDRLVVIDEAYIKFGGETCVPLTKQYQNLLVVGTFSKAYAMAGARLGYAVGCEALIGDLNRLKYSLNPYNVNSMTQAAGAAALAEKEYFAGCVQKVKDVRGWFTAGLRAMGFHCADSQTNFVLCCHPDHGGETLFLGLREKGILVRWFNSPRIQEYLRITIGTAGEMDAVLKALGELTA